jgi:hypothetical protein
MKTKHNTCSIKLSMMNQCVCVCVCVLRILIKKDKILPFLNYSVRIYNILQQFAAHWLWNTDVHR